MAEFLNRMFRRAVTHWTNRRSCKRTAALVAVLDVDNDVPQMAGERPIGRHKIYDSTTRTAEYLAQILRELRAQPGLPPPIDPALISAWQRLPLRQRRLLLLYEVRGLTSRQLARRLKLPEAVVRETLVAAIVRFRYELEALECTEELNSQVSARSDQPLLSS